MNGVLNTFKDPIYPNRLNLTKLTKCIKELYQIHVYLLSYGNKHRIRNIQELCDGLDDDLKSLFNGLIFTDRRTGRSGENILNKVDDLTELTKCKNVNNKGINVWTFNNGKDELLLEARKNHPNIPIILFDDNIETLKSASSTGIKNAYFGYKCWKDKANSANDIYNVNTIEDICDLIKSITVRPQPILETSQSSSQPIVETSQSSSQPIVETSQSSSQPIVETSQSSLQPILDLSQPSRQSNLRRKINQAKEHAKEHADVHDLKKTSKQLLRELRYNSPDIENNTVHWHKCADILKMDHSIDTLEFIQEIIKFDKNIHYKWVNEELIEFTRRDHDKH